MKRQIFIILLFLFFFPPKTLFAIENPATFTNNKFGIHILFTSELEKAANLVNSSGGDWGYVTIPIQVGDKDLEKWQKFMDSTKQHHIIPIIRLATEADYFNTSVWRKPTEEDILDFANFLDSLNWPVKNRYIVVFNEVNRGDEWEGSPNPNEYALILNYAVDVFKSKSEDFFIISAGLDNAAEDVYGSSMNEYNFLRQMDEEVPQIFNKIDGLGSHSYPNPNFSQPPWIQNSKSISSFRFEKNFAFTFSGKELPVFITETGWTQDKLSQSQIAGYLINAFENIWVDSDIVAITPFLLHAGTPPFSQFSFLDEDGNLSEISKTYQRLSKIKGAPTLNANTLLEASEKQKIPSKTFRNGLQFENPSFQKILFVLELLKWLFRLSG